MHQEKDEHIIRVKSDKPANTFITQAAFKFLKEQIKNPREGESTTSLDYVVFSASGKAVHTALIAADVIRRKIAGLHQVIRIYTTMPTGQFGNQVEDEQFRYEQGPKLLSVMDIILTKVPTAEMKKEAGYSAALPSTEEQKTFTLEEIIQRKRPVPYGNNHYNRYNNQRHHNYNNYNQQQDEDGQQVRGYRGASYYGQRKSSYGSQSEYNRSYNNSGRLAQARESYKKGGQRSQNNVINTKNY